MTVQYYQDVLTVGPMTFIKLLKRWRGSVFKLIYKDAIGFGLFYIFVSCIYRFLLDDERRRTFEKIVIYVSSLLSYQPIAFVLGFYVEVVFRRFWTHFNTVPWITKIAMLLSAHLNAYNSEEEKREALLQKRSIIRYLVAAQIITLSRVSVPVRRRFPQLSDLYSAGILHEHEVTLIMETQPVSMQPYLPIAWCTSIVMKASDQGRITNDLVLIGMIKEIDKFRHMLQELFLLDHICVPLVYTQVVTLAVYAYFISSVIGNQFIIVPNNPDRKIDFVIPIFTILQFIVYMGWLKLALVLVNPMGEDDEDFDLNTVVNYNFEVGMAIVDKLSNNQPKFEKDVFFNQPKFELPMKRTMTTNRQEPFMGSVYNLKVEDDHWMTSLQSIITTNSDFIDRKRLDDTFLQNNFHTIDFAFDETIQRISGKNKQRLFPARRHKSTASSFTSTCIRPITEEEVLYQTGQGDENVSHCSTTLDSHASTLLELNKVAEKSDDIKEENAINDDIEGEEKQESDI